MQAYEIDPVNNDDSNDEILTIAWKQNQVEDQFYSCNKPETYKFRYATEIPLIKYNTSAVCMKSMNVGTRKFLTEIVSKKMFSLQ